MKLSVLVLLPVVNFRVNLVMKSASSFSKTKGEAISKSFFMPITARYGVDKTEKRQPRRKGKHLRLHNVCPLLRHPQNDADLEPHPQQDVRTVLLPRNDKQKAAIARRWAGWLQSGKIIIPGQVVEGLNLIWHSDLVISGGGTMNREAAALGVPVSPTALPK